MTSLSIINLDFLNSLQPVITNGHVDSHSDVSQKTDKFIMLDFALQYFRESVER